MNPASVGGGRSRLPRSVRNLFTAVELQAPSSEELKAIMLQLLYPAVQRGLLDKEHVLHLLDFHQAAVQAVQHRDIGRGQGAASEPNLRDLIKVSQAGTCRPYSCCCLLCCCTIATATAASAELTHASALVLGGTSPSKYTCCNQAQPAVL
jgi:midasin (ATPase involved in ribosome maturation)